MDILTIPIIGKIIGRLIMWLWKLREQKAKTLLEELKLSQTKQQIKHKEDIEIKSMQLYKTITETIAEVSNKSGPDRIPIHKKMFSPIPENEVFIICIEKLLKEKIIHEDSEGYYFSRFENFSFNKDKKSND